MTNIDRRNFLIGSTAILTTTGLGYTLLDSDTALGAEITDLTIPDKSYTSQNMNIDRIDVNLTVDYEYLTNVNPKEVVFRLKAGLQNGSTNTIQTKSITENLLQEQTGSIDLVGNILESSWLDQTMLVPSSEGETKTNTLLIEVVMELFDSTSALIGSTTTSAEPILEMNYDGVELTASIGGSGELKIVPV